MKFIPVAVTALLCATIAFGAPSTKNLSSDEIAYMSQFMKTEVNLELFRCAFGVLAQASKDNGLEELWSTFERQLQQNLDSWAECSTLENVLAVYFCNAKEGFRTSKAFLTYAAIASKQNPEFLRPFLVSFFDTCDPPEDVLPFEIAKVVDGVNVEYPKSPKA